MYIYQTTTAYSNFHFDTSSSQYQTFSYSDSLNEASQSGYTSVLRLYQGGFSGTSITTYNTYRRTIDATPPFQVGNSQSGFSYGNTLITGLNQIQSGSSTSTRYSFDSYGASGESATRSGSYYTSDGTIQERTDAYSGFINYGTLTFDDTSYTTGSTTNTYSRTIPSSTTQTLSRKITTSTTSQYGYILSTLLSGSIISTTSSTSQYNILRTTSTNDFTITRSTTSSASTYTPYLLVNVYKTQANWSLGYNIGYLDTVPPQTLLRKSDMLLQTAETTLTERITKNKTTISAIQTNGNSYAGTSVGAEIIETTYSYFATIPSVATLYYWSGSGVSQSTQGQFLLSTSTYTDYSYATQIEPATFYGPTSTREDLVGVGPTTTTQFNLVGSLNTPITISGVLTTSLISQSSVYGLPSVYSSSTIVTSPNATATYATSQTLEFEQESYDTSTFYNYGLAFDEVYGSQDRLLIIKQHGDLLHIANHAYLPATTSVSENLGYFEITNPLSFNLHYANYLSYGPSYGNYSGILKNFRANADAEYTYNFNIGKYDFFNNGRIVPEIGQSSYSFVFNDDIFASTQKSITLSYSDSGTYFYTLATDPTTRTESTVEFLYGNQMGTMYRDTINFLQNNPLYLFQLTSVGGFKQMLYGTDYGSFVDIPFTTNLQSFIVDTYGVTSNSARKSFFYTKITDSSGGTTSGTTAYSTFSSTSASFLEAYANIFDGWQLVSNYETNSGRFPTPIGYPLIYPNLAYFSQNVEIYPRSSSFSLNSSAYYSSAFTTFS